jgi:DNA-binding PadR family transcriptional regulator
VSRRSALAEFEIQVMLSVKRLGEEAYGARIRHEIEERGGRRVSMGAVYSTLGRLEDRGLLRSSESDPMPVRGGRSRKVYAPTAGGRAALDETAAMLLRMMDGLAFGSGRGS